MEIIDEDAVKDKVGHKEEVKVEGGRLELPSKPKN